MSAWRTSDVRADVARDFEQSKQVAIQGSPQIIWPDGITTHNPGMSDHHWRGGLLRINSTDPEEPARLLRKLVESSRQPSRSGLLSASLLESSFEPLRISVPNPGPLAIRI